MEFPGEVADARERSGTCEEGARKSKHSVPTMSLHGAVAEEDAGPLIKGRS